MDPNCPPIDDQAFKSQDWSQQYGDLKEAIPANAPSPRGRDVVLRMMVDSDHAKDEADCRSRMGYMIFVNMSLIGWLTQRQKTVEKAVFGSEFVAMTHGVET